jgi:hypothetical protein
MCRNQTWMIHSAISTDELEAQPRVPPKSFNIPPQHFTLVSHPMSQYSTMLPLVLYDVISDLPGNNFSPNPAKSRLVVHVMHAT